jgi:N-acetylneuraminic acid mutarotase
MSLRVGGFFYCKEESTVVVFYLVRMMCRNFQAIGKQNRFVKLVLGFAFMISFLSFDLRLVNAQGDHSNSWKKIDDMPVPRWEAGTVVLDDKLYVFGGYTKGTRSSKRVDVFNPKDGSWKKLSDLPSAITHMNAVLDGRFVWLAGGFKDGYKGYAIAEVWKYDIEKDMFTAAPPLPERRGGGGLALVGRNLHYIGGLLPDRVTDADTHWILNLNELEKGEADWTEAAKMPEPRNQFGVLSLNGKIYTIGGQFGHDRGQIDQSRVDVYDPKTNSWTQGTNLPSPHSHAEGSTFISNGRIFTLGGMTREGKRRRIDNKIIAQAPGNKWAVLGELPKPLSSPAAAIIGDQLILAGGSLNGADPQPGVWIKKAPQPISMEADSVESQIKIHRLASTKRGIFDAFTYINRIPDSPEEDESAIDLAGRILGRLANQEGRILLKLPPGMDREAYYGFKTFISYEGENKVGNCVACHSVPDFTDLKTHVIEKGGTPKPTPSLRNLKERKLNHEEILLKKIKASQQKKSGTAKEIADAYQDMNISKEDIPELVKYLNLMNDVSDEKFRELILNAKLLDTSQDIE